MICTYCFHLVSVTPWEIAVPLQRQTKKRSPTPALPEGEGGKTGSFRMTLLKIQKVKQIKNTKSYEKV